MPANSPFPVPEKGAIFQWAMENEDALIELVRFVNLLYALEVNIVPPGGYNTAQQGLIISATNALLPIPLRLPSPIANDTTATAASVSAKINELLEALRKTGQLPR